MKKRKDGRFQSSVTVTNPITGEKIRKYVYAYSKKDLQLEKERAIKEANMLSTYLPTLLKDFFEHFVTSRLSDKRITEASALQYRTVFEKSILPNLPKDISLGDIKLFHVRKMIDAIPYQSRKKYALGLLRMMLQEAVYEQLLDNNVCVNMRPPKTETKHAAVVSPDVYKQMLEFFAGKIYYYVLSLAFETGCRMGEICALQWNDFKDNTLHIHATVIRSLNRIGPPKTKSSIRTITLTPACCDMLISWKRLCKLRCMEQGLPLPDYIFSDNGTFLRPSKVNNAVDYFKKQCGITAKISPHSLRHTHATILAAQDLNPKKIQNRLGHATARFTMDTYIHSTGEAGVVEALEKAENIYKAKYNDVKNDVNNTMNCRCFQKSAVYRRL